MAFVLPLQISQAKIRTFRGLKWFIMKMLLLELQLTQPTQLHV